MTVIRMHVMRFRAARRALFSPSFFKNEIFINSVNYGERDLSLSINSYLLLSYGYQHAMRLNVIKINQKKETKKKKLDLTLLNYAT